jgi:hypothetical protein
MRFDKLTSTCCSSSTSCYRRAASRAAERLFLSQPATSLSLRRLREYSRMSSWCRWARRMS